MTRGYEGKGNKLRVKDAFKEDAGRGIVRIDPDIEAELNLRTGDVIEISHPTVNMKTAALLYPGRREDKGTGIIRIDPSLRRNINTSLDEIVEIRKIEAALATRVTFAGLEETVIIRNSQQLARKLENRVITKGDILSFYAMGRRVDLVVVEYSPKAEAVRIHLDTKVILSEKSHKEITEKEEVEQILEGADAWIDSIRARGDKPRGLFPCENFCIPV